MPIVSISQFHSASHFEPAIASHQLPEAYLILDSKDYICLLTSAKAMIHSSSAYQIDALLTI